MCQRDERKCHDRRMIGDEFGADCELRQTQPYHHPLAEREFVCFREAEVEVAACLEPRRVTFGHRVMAESSGQMPTLVSLSERASPRMQPQRRNILATGADNRQGYLWKGGAF